MTDVEDVGKPFYTSEDFSEVAFDDALKNYKQFTQAVHGMIYTRLEGKLWDIFPKNATALVFNFI